MFRFGTVRHDVDSLSPMNLMEYRDLLDGQAPPTEEQMRGFAKFVSSAHSWYKHLPPIPPGRPFCFYLDPLAGFVCMEDEDGRLRFLPRTGDTPQLHYSEMTTQRYRERFGCLTYSCAYGTQVGVVLPVGLLTSAEPSYPVAYDRQGRCRSLPEELVDAGSILLTGVIHDYCANEGWWRSVESEGPANWAWPPETGGLDMLRRILLRCREIRETPAGQRPRILRKGGLVDPILLELLGPERHRLQNEMLLAMRRMIAVVHG